MDFDWNWRGNTAGYWAARAKTQVYSEDELGCGHWKLGWVDRVGQTVHSSESQTGCWANNVKYDLKKEHDGSSL